MGESDSSSHLSGSSLRLFAQPLLGLLRTSDIQRDVQTPTRRDPSVTQLLLTTFVSCSAPSTVHSSYARAQKADALPLSHTHTQTAHLEVI